MANDASSSDSDSDDTSSVVGAEGGDALMEHSDDDEGIVVVQDYIYEFHEREQREEEKVSFVPEKKSCGTTAAEEERTYDGWVKRVESLRGHVLSLLSQTQETSVGAAKKSALELRHAREAFQRGYPLSESLWFAWLQDEVALRDIPSSSPSSVLSALRGEALGSDQVLALHRRACISDYTTSWPLWEAYLNVAAKSNAEKRRAACEEAIEYFGSHMIEGYRAWDAFADFAAEAAAQQLRSSCGIRTALLSTTTRGRPQYRHSGMTACESNATRRSGWSTSWRRW